MSSADRTDVGVIYRGYEGYWYPHFLDWGYCTPTFQDEKVKIYCHLQLATEAICRESKLQ